MHNSNIPSETELPSKSRLIKSTLLAIVMAAIILVAVVLPAEYGIDPTGMGEAIGLLKMGQIKVSLAEEVKNEKTKQDSQVINDSPSTNKDIEPVEAQIEDEVETAVPSGMIQLTLAPNQGKEIKLKMKKGASVNYVWWSDGGKANFDLHADSKPLNIKYHSYEKGSKVRAEGILVADFDGNHGWFWRNRTSETITVTLEVSGDYSDIIEM